MQNSCRWSLGLLPCLVGLALLPAQFAKADTVFDVSGSAVNVFVGGSLDSCASHATCDFSGTFQVDVTTGRVDGVYIAFPGLTAFDTLTDSLSTPATWLIIVDNSTNSSSETLLLAFNTAPTSGSLVGFTGGTILSSSAVVSSVSPNLPFYTDLTGTITPVPEPSSLGLLAVALLAFSEIIRPFSAIIARTRAARRS